MLKSCEELQKNMKTTSGSRFNAAKRLEARERALTRLTAFTSVYVIGLTILPYFLKVPLGFTNLLNLLTCFLGVVMLASSLLQYSAKDGVNAEQHHRCALEIGQIRRAIKIDCEVADEKRVEEYTDQYNRILERYSINHDDIDYTRYQNDRPEEFPWITKAGWMLIKAKILLSKQAMNFWLIVITIMFAVVVYMSIKAGNGLAMA